MRRDRVDALVAATWPPRRDWSVGPFTLRDGGGGGKRVSAASTTAAVTERDIDRAERAMDDAGQQALFAVFAGQDDLDARLAGRTYLCLDPTILYSGGTGDLADLPVMPFDVTIGGSACDDARALWQAGGIGPARIDVMDRVRVPKGYVLARKDGGAVATGFVAIHDGIAMVHALEVAKAHRRQGAARATMAAMARWAHARGAADLSLLVTRANVAANALYRDLGLTGRPCYHYRIRP